MPAPTWSATRNHLDAWTSWTRLARSGRFTGNSASDRVQGPPPAWTEPGRRPGTGQDGWTWGREPAPDPYAGLPPGDGPGLLLLPRPSVPCPFIRGLKPTARWLGRPQSA